MKTLQRGLLSGILTLALGACAWSAEIPATLDTEGANPDQAVRLLENAGLSHGEAVSQAQSLDRVELAELGRSDLEQKGGDPFTSFALILGVVVILGLLWVFTACEA